MSNPGGGDRKVVTNELYSLEVRTRLIRISSGKHNSLKPRNRINLSKTLPYLAGGTPLPQTPPSAWEPIGSAGVPWGRPWGPQGRILMIIISCHIDVDIFIGFTSC